ncbi:MAG: 16S rRNA (adenine(1518)-N(6)/adenine(1519)-N(6))-dimethyltransferase RsmA, partial [Candidatus Omnitrophica bacterium]|nr:16S rRNA (adenine(1518)-N(6)/adenine(1519)-N(6))-dimethyltransferase RsmA [Candidatus Omnitrophota bacterium]
MRIQPKKSLGQNFLIDQNIRNKIIASLDLKKNDVVLEIGSGKGELTQVIAQRANKVFGLEIDKRLYNFLTSEFAGTGPNTEIINKDILKLDLTKFLKENKIKGRIKVFGNIPYYISSPIIEHLLKFRDRIEAIFITVQKEFAARVAALPGGKAYGSFSCFTQYYTCPRIIFNIGRNCFKPAPKVDSSFLELKIRKEPAVCVKDEVLFFKIIRGALNQRRKTLRNSLEGIIPAVVLNDLFARF